MNQTMDNSKFDTCEDELNKADLCIIQTPEKCNCIGQLDSFAFTYPAELDSAFEGMINDQRKQDKESFCEHAESRICE